MKRLLIALAFLLGTTEANAQWAKLPNGEWGYTGTYTFSATYSCNTVWLWEGRCTASTDGWLVENGDAWAHISFKGVTTSITSTNVRHPVHVGAMVLETGGTGPMFWPDAHKQSPILRMTMKMSDVSDGGGFNVVDYRWRFTDPVSIPMNCCEGRNSYGQFWPGEPNPAGLNYSIIIDQFTYPTLDLAAPGDVQVYAAIGLVPEPSTNALMTLGLAAVGLLGRRRKACYGNRST